MTISIVARLVVSAVAPLLAGAVELAEPLPLGEAAAVPIMDDVAGDRTGGWTDQGDNDLRQLPAGVLTVDGTTFTIGGRAVVLSGGRQSWRPRHAVIQGGGRQGACLHLLHASAWTPPVGHEVGRVRLIATTGESEERSIRSGQEVCDWWYPPDHLPSAAVAWRSDNGHAKVGLVEARIPITARPLERIELEVTGDALWMVVAMALGPSVRPPAPVADRIEPGRRWLPAEVTWEVEPGSALDLSALNPGPVTAGLERRGAHLWGADGPVRLLGGNLCYSACFPPPAMAARLARGLRALGYNAVRLHHFDGMVVRPGGDGLAWDEERLDRLDRLVAACKAEGLRVVIDLYSCRRIPAGTIPELPERSLVDGFKAAVPLLPSALEHWKAYATRLLGHRNPHTGLTWAEEPALAAVCLINEDNLRTWQGHDPAIRQLVDRSFAAWLAGRPPEERASEAVARLRWLCAAQTAALRAMEAHVRGLGLRAPVTSANFQQDWWSLAVRDGLPLIDNHIYHDHPRFPGAPWQLPYAFHQGSALDDLVKVPTAIAHSRRLDLPFLVTEVNYCQPNHRRAEYAVAVPAVAGLQDWDGLWRFTFASGLEALTAEGASTGFGIARDPIGLLAERAVALLFRRGDVAPAPWAVAVAVDPQVAAGSTAEPPLMLRALALHARTGWLPRADCGRAGELGVRALLHHRAAGEPPASSMPVIDLEKADALPWELARAGLCSGAAIDRHQRRTVSAGGQVVADGRAGTMSVATALSVAAIVPGAGEVAAGPVRLANRDRDQAVMVVAALDRQPIPLSRRLLVLHLTDAQNAGVRFADQRHTRLEQWGTGAMLVRAGAATISLPGEGTVRAWALDLRGTRREEVQITSSDGRLAWDLEVARAWGPCLAWEVIRE